MKIGVIHDSLNFVGGAERVCLKTIEALQEAGHRVILGTVEPTAWDKVQALLGSDSRPDEEFHLFPASIGSVRAYLDVFVPLVLRQVKKKVLTCINTNADVMPTETEINYLHYVPGSSLRGAFIRPDFVYSGLYFMPYRSIQRTKIKNLSSGMIITNSIFSQRAIKQCLGLNSSVIYPPVDIHKFLGTSDNVRSNSIVTTGRMSPERNFEFVLLVAAELRDFRFSIIGHVSGAASRFYYEKLCKIRNTKGLDNVTIVLNYSFSKMLSYFSSGKIFLHTMKNEAFGLSVAEAMASGLVPVVHKSGGPWEDMLEGKNGTNGYSYSTVTEAKNAILSVISDEKSCRNMVSRNRLKVKEFSDVSFKAKMLRAFNELNFS